jgi:hypothetical protein
LIENEIYYELTSIIKLNYFENENKKIKKIACGNSNQGFNLFLTGCYFFKKNLKKNLKKI